MSYHYIYHEVNKDHPTFLLLHGTGGTEEDLLQVAKILDESYNVIAVRGDVSENGANRFFKRHSHGDYDVDDLNQRGKKLYAFVEELAEKENLAMDKVIPVGFSNGSNIAINMILRPEAPFKRAILMAPMYPVEVDAGPDLSDMKVFLSMGKEDPISSLLDSENVIRLFEERGAELTEHWTQTHAISRDVLAAAKEFLHA